MRYETFELTVSRGERAGRYRLRARSTTQGEAEAGIRIDLARERLPEMAEIRKRATMAAELENLGTALYRSLFVGEIETLWKLSFGEVSRNPELGLRLRLRVDPPELAVLAWELLYAPERRLFLATSAKTPMSRHLALLEPVRQMACPDVVRLLAIMPEGSGLDTEAESENLRRIEANLGGKIAVDRLTGKATSRAIRDHLRQRAYQLVHFAGHGAFHDGEAVIYLDSEAEMPVRVRAAEFAQLFLDDASVRLVVLNACHGATRSAQEVLAGVAPHLLRRGIPAVVGMQCPINNPQAVDFATEFYSELTSERRGGQVESALAQARNALLQDHPRSLSFAYPVLYLRAPDGRLWNPRRHEPPAFGAPDDLAALLRRNAQLHRKGLEPLILPRIPRKEVQEKYLPVIRASMEQERYRIIPIVGPAGYGKTTVLGEIYDELTATPNTWVALIDCGSLIFSPQEHLSQSFGEAICGEKTPIEEVVDVLTRGGTRGLILIDTLDLVLDRTALAQLQRIFSALVSLRVTIVFTCRDHDYRTHLEPPRQRLAQIADHIDRYSVPRFNIVEIEAATRAFIEHHPKIADEGAAHSFIERILTLSADNQPLLQITSNPLLLAMLCDLFGAEGHVPQDLTVSMLYNRYWDEKIASSRLYGPRSAETLVKPAICLKIAQQLLEMSRQRLYAAVFESDLDLTPSEPVAHARAELLSESVLKTVPGGRLRFFHQTLLEYAMARWLVTRDGSSARTRIMAAVQNHTASSGTLHWWPILRQLLSLVDEAGFESIAKRLPTTELAAFRILSLAAVSRSNPSWLDTLLGKALAQGDEYQKVLAVALDAVSSFMVEKAWCVIDRLLGEGEKGAAIVATQIAGVLLSRRLSPVASCLPKLLDTINRRRQEGDQDVAMNIAGQLVRECMPALENDPAPVAIFALQRHWISLGARTQVAVIRLFQNPKIHNELRCRLLRELLSVRLPAKLQKEVTPLLEQVLPELIGSDRENVWPDWTEALHAQLPEGWETSQCAAVAHHAARHPELLRCIVHDLLTNESGRIKRNINALLFAIRAGGARDLSKIISHLSLAEIPSERASVIVRLTHDLGSEVSAEMRVALSSWLKSMAINYPQEALIGLSALADSSDTSWEFWANHVRTLLVSRRFAELRKLIRAGSPGVRRRLWEEMSPLLESPPLGKDQQLILVQIYASRTDFSPDVVSSLCELSLSRFNDVALAASNVFAIHSSDKGRMSASDLLPTLDTRNPGVLDHILTALLNIESVGDYFGEVVLLRVCRRVCRETGHNSVRQFCELVYRWVRRYKKAPPREVSRVLAATPERLTKLGELEGGVTFALIRVLKALAQLEIPEIVPDLERGATEILHNINYNRVEHGISETVDLLAALARLDSELLPRVVATGSTLPGKNLRAVVGAVRRVEGEDSPLLAQIIDGGNCPPDVERLTLSIKGI